MLDELRQLADSGERAGLPIGPSAVRRRAHGRQVRRRVAAGGAGLAAIAAVVIVLAVGAGRTPRAQQVHVGGVAPTTGLPLDGPVIADQGALRGLTFVDDNLGYALDGPSLARTEDGGLTWYQIGGHGLAGLTSLRFASGAVGYAWEAGELLATEDGGATWRPVDVPNQVFDLRTDGRATQVLVGCTDGSCNESLWSLSDGTSALINTIQFRATAGSIALNPAHGAPTSVATSDGTTAKLFWVDSQPNNVATLSDPCPADATVQQTAATAAASGGDLWLVCAGSDPTSIQQPKSVFHSSDSGQSWTLMASVGSGHNAGSIPLDGQVAGLVAGGQGVGWLAVDQVGVLVTTDAGATWKPAVPVASGSGPAEVAGITGGPQLWAISDHALWHSPDGVTWARF